MEEHDLQRVAGILRFDQLRERERHALGRREAVLAVQDHGVTAVEHQHGRAGALILALDHHEILVRNLNRSGGWRLEAGRKFRALTRLPRDGVQQRRRGVEVERIAEFVRLRRASGFDPRCLFTGIVPTETALAE